MAGLAEALVQDLQTLLAAENNPTTAITPVGLTVALGQQLASGALNVVSADQGDGGFRSVRIRYIQRAANTAATSFSCNAPNRPLYRETTVQLPYFAEQQFRVRYNDLAALLPGDRARTGQLGGQNLHQFILTGLVSSLNPIYQRMEAVNLGVAFSASGRNPRPNVAGGTAVARQFINTTGRTIAQRGFVDVRRDFQFAELGGRPLIVTSVGSVFAEAHYSRNLAASTDGGVNLTQLDTVLPYQYAESESAEAQLGGVDRFLAIAPGSIHLVDFQQYRGPQAMANELGIVRTLFVDPRTQIAFDIELRFDPCTDPTVGGEFIVAIRKRWGIFVQPPDTFNAADRLNNVTGIMLYNSTAA